MPAENAPPRTHTHTPTRSDSLARVKARTIAADRGSAVAKYRFLCYGDMPLGRAILAEAVFMLAGQLQGAAGLWLRGKLYRLVLGSVGRGAVFGRGLTLRHPHKIRVGAATIIEDFCVLDAKGDGNEGIVLGDGVFIGRGSIVNCKGGSIVIEAGANISSGCNFVASDRLVIGAGTMIGAGSYAVNGGDYDYTSRIPFADQTAVSQNGPLCIGPNCWLGANVTVLDAASIGEHCVIGAGSVVTRPVPPDSVAYGVPARIARRRPGPCPPQGAGGG